MSLKFQVNNIEWIEETSQFNEDFIKTIIKKMIKDIFLKLMLNKKLHELHNDLPFLSEGMKIKKVEKIVANLNDKCKYDIHIRNLKSTLSNGLFLRLVHTVIKFNQKSWLEPYIKMNTELRQKPTNNFEKGFFKLINNERSF